MIRIKLTNYFQHWPLVRQTPQRLGRWGNCEFFVNDNTSECDFWAVQDDVTNVEEVVCGRDGLILLPCEPPSVRSYSTAFLKQFSTVLGCQPDLLHPNLRITLPFLPWWYGVKYLETDPDSHFGKVVVTSDYDDMLAHPPEIKAESISIICSAKTMTAGHRARLEFVEKLRKHFGSSLHVYGKGFNDIADKRDAISPYRYHIVLENSIYPHYWTEKLADAYLGNAFPLYYGCPNISDYFNADSLSAIDISNPSVAIDKISAAIDGNLYESRRSLLTDARISVLNQHNLFARLAAYCETVGLPTRFRRVRIRPHSHFKPSILSRGVRKYKYLVNAYKNRYAHA